jgi:hypothetical protein
MNAEAHLKKREQRGEEETVRHLSRNKMAGMQQAKGEG